MKDLTITEYKKISPKITHEEFVAAYNAGEEIRGFDGCVKVEFSVLDNSVPEVFPNSSFSIEVDGEVISMQKKFKDYTTYFESEDGKCMLQIGYRVNTNLTHIIESEELYMWLDYFGIENALTKSDYTNQIKIQENDF